MLSGARSDKGLSRLRCPSATQDAANVASTIEAALPKAFKLDAKLIKVAVLSRKSLEAVVDKRPKGFGDEPTKKLALL